mmetsp:Transcript_22196/g.46830  ORF Transcript_22196/g.46830 Transcript_22196/m.46830 type:complete len:439 (+) Transcript_22196:220-1536(+)
MSSPSLLARNAAGLAILTWPALAGGLLLRPLAPPLARPNQHALRSAACGPLAEISPEIISATENVGTGLAAVTAAAAASALAYVANLKREYDRVGELQAKRDAKQRRKSKSVPQGSSAYVHPKDFWSESELQAFDGTSSPDGPILLAADGVVYNVALSRNFYGPSGEYHAFAGRDASRLLAKGLTSAEDDTAKEAPLSLAERAALAAWAFSFKSKYDAVGVLRSAAQTAEAEAAAAAKLEKELQVAAELMRASAAGDVKGVQQALYAFADITWQDADGYLPLHRAAEAGSVECVRVLLDAGADVHSVGSKGRTAMHHAAEKGHVDVMSALIEAGADIQAEANQRWTPLLAASQAGAMGALKLLLERDADANKASQAGVTPLIAAATYGHVEACQLLLQAGGLPETLGPRGKTASQWASEKGQTAVVTLLESALASSLD